MKILIVKNLVRNYRKAYFKESEEDIKVLKKISIYVSEGEFVVIMGKSGCGKTTLLKTLGMIDKPTDGEIYFLGEDTSKLYGDKLADFRYEKIGFIFQDFYIMDSLSVEENIMLPMIIGKKEIHNMKKLARKYAEQFQIGHLLNKNPYSRSPNTDGQDARNKKTLRQGIARNCPNCAFPLLYCGQTGMEINNHYSSSRPRWNICPLPGPPGKQR